MTVREVFVHHGHAYLNAFGDRMPDHHKKVITAIIQCPTCQGDKAVQWLNNRMEQLLPVAHFMITCTVPAAFREFFRSHQRFAYSALFEATSKTLSALASEPTWFSGDTPGFFGVLHTWGRQLSYHPHIHYLVPGGARSLRYLASYVFRTAISNHRILTADNEHVLFRYTDTRTGKHRTMSLSPFEFIRRFLQHVLPSGFMKIRYYGFMHPSTSMPVKLAAALLEAMLASPPQRPAPIEPTAIPCCERCQGTVRFLRFIPPEPPDVTVGFT